MADLTSTLSDRRLELADFLRRRRARLSPTKSTGRRRTPGLRREEIALLAGLSVDWYTRLEQGRDVNPSTDTLEALAEVFRLDEHEREHMFFLARGTRHRRLPDHEVVDDSLASALGAMNNPAQVINARFDVLASNAAARAFLCACGDNVLRSMFLSDKLRQCYVLFSKAEEDTVASFRASADQYLGDPRFEALLQELLAGSARFRELWARHDVRPKLGGRKLMRTPAGEIALDWHTLASPASSGQILVFYIGASPEDQARLCQLTP
jgi:transcriptional regulator with XRE-family HTH domain